MACQRTRYLVHCLPTQDVYLFEGLRWFLCDGVLTQSLM